MTTTSKNVFDALETAKTVLSIEARAILDLIPRLDDSFRKAVGLLESCRGRIVTTGLGKSGIIARKIAATMASTGSPAHFLHPVEAIHGDLGMIAQGDVVVMLSNSGETPELLDLVATHKRLDVSLIALVGNAQSSLGRNADAALNVGVDREACPLGLAPTASTTASLALGDALALTLSQRKGFRVEDFARLHPGGVLGKKFARVGDLMLSGEQVPKVGLDTPMEDVIYEMSRKGLGVTTVVTAEGRLAGLISDGDLRRHLQSDRERILSLKAADCMTPNPVTIDIESLATAALNRMETRKITSLIVTDQSGRLEGVIHLHHLWGTEMI